MSFFCIQLYAVVKPFRTTKVIKCCVETTFWLKTAIEFKAVNLKQGGKSGGSRSMSQKKSLKKPTIYVVSKNNFADENKN